MIGNKKIIAVCVSRVQDNLTNKFITALYTAISDKDYRIFVYNTNTVVTEENYEKDVQTKVYDLIDYDIVDAVVILDVIQNPSIIKMLVERAKAHGILTMVVGEGEACEGCINIKFDYEGGFAEVVRHAVCHHKFKKLHFMAGLRGNLFSDQRMRVFQSVLEENGIPFDESMVSYGDYWTKPTEQAMIKLIESNNLPEVVVCANDKMAIAVCNILKTYGIRVPEDVAVTGFDGVFEVLFSTPRITTVETEYSELANETARVLMDSDNWLDRTETILVPLHICVGQSCGCEGKTAINASEYLLDMDDRFFRYIKEDIELSKVIAQVQRCDNVAQVVDSMKTYIFYEFACMVDTECLDETINPTQRVEYTRGTDRDMYVLFDCRDYDRDEPYLMSSKMIVPRLEEILDLNRVLIFSTLHHLDVEFGYVCFYYAALEQGNYTKVPQTMNALNNAIGGFRTTRHKQYLMNQINEMYRTDTLTGLRNRRGFDMEYQELLNDRKENETLTIIMVDLDGLKFINDNHGHKEGDYAIHAVAQAMRKTCPEGTIFTRFGGDEMLAVYRGRLDAGELKENFYVCIDEINARSKKRYDVLASMGVYHTEEDDDLSFESIIEKSDVLMYMEKNKRKRARVR